MSAPDYRSWGKSFLYPILCLVVLWEMCMKYSPLPSLKRVWMDVDFSAGLPGRDIDDAMAMLQLFHNEDVDIVGVGTVFGNTEDLDYMQEKTLYMISKFARYDIPIFRGASSAAQLFTPSPASNALSQLITLSESNPGIAAPLVIFAIGPVTNIATALWQAGDAAVRRNVKEVIVVAGRTPNDRFIVGPHELSDLNFESDHKAFAYLLSLPELPLVFVPYELSSKVHITIEDVNILRSHGGDASEFIFNVSQPWLSHWMENFQLPYFNLFDAMAGLRILRINLLSCSKLQ
eukprot:439313_1